jgi:hypothetical protein
MSKMPARKQLNDQPDTQIDEPAGLIDEKKEGINLETTGQCGSYVIPSTSP